MKLQPLIDKLVEKAMALQLMSNHLAEDATRKEYNYRRGKRNLRRFTLT
jgi:hypothetical protein